MEKRYQVFVSSTYNDLKEERIEVIQALLELDCIPVGMEYFPAADESQWNFIHKIRSTYWRILEKKHLGRDGKTLTCDSFRKIVEEIKSTINDGLRSGLGVLELTNNIIFKILNGNYFVYENHQMAALIGYIYLKKQSVEIKNYTFNGINGNSTLDEIRIITASW